MNVQLIRGNKINTPKYKNIDETKMKVAAYVRVSTDHEDQKNSLENQTLYYQRKISKNTNWEFVGIYSDEGISGTTYKARHGFKQMIKDACNGKIDFILTKSVSRFARNTYDTLNYIRMLNGLGVHVLFEEESINTMKMNNELLLTVLSAVAQQEVINLSEHVQLGKQMRMQQGKNYGTMNCFGYDYSKETKLLSINKEQAQLVRRIFDLYLEGNGTLKIATILSDEGIPTIKGQRYWNEGSITHILKNEKYIGDLIMNKYHTIDPLLHKTRPNRGERDMYIIRNHHEPIISKEVFDKVQEEMSRRNKRCKHDGYSCLSRYAFSGKFKCGFCGNTVKRSKTHNVISKARYGCSRGLGQTTYKCEKSKQQSEDIIKKAFMQSSNRLRNHIKNENKFSIEMNEKLKYARTILYKYSSIDIDKFDSDLFEKLIKFGILGEIDEKDKVQPYTIRFIINTEKNPFLKEEIGGHIDLEKLKTKTLIDFYSNQMWQDMDENGRVRYNNRFHVFVDLELDEDYGI